ncbi:MAG: hypothetical protein K2Q10_05410 [Rhodospirillales bacterium]|nr:hypothetical protein [Rhodospirillales bacterium]
MAMGVLVLVIGAHTERLVEAAKRRIGDDHRFLFPRRVITRTDGEGFEVHRRLTPAQFDMLRREGAFALYWTEEGVNFALPASIEEDLAMGKVVVAAASRAVLDEAKRHYPRVETVIAQPTDVTQSFVERLERLALSPLAAQAATFTERLGPMP